MTEAALEAVTEAATDAVTEAVTDAAIEAATDAATDAVIEAATDAPTDARPSVRTNARDDLVAGVRVGSLPSLHPVACIARRICEARVVAIAVLVALAILATAQRADAQREPGWELRVPERLELAVGATAPLTVALAVDRGLAVSKDAAVILDVAPADGAMIKKRRLGRSDAVDPEADAPRFAIAVRGDVPGEHVVQLHLRFWLCARATCRPIDARRTVVVHVRAE